MYPERGIRAKTHQFRCLGPPLWIRRSGLGPRTLLLWELVAVPSGLNTLSSKPKRGCLGSEPDGCSRHPVGAVSMSGV